MIAPPGVAKNMRAWATEIEQLLPPLATGHLRDINGDSSGVVFITGTPYYWSALPVEAHAHQARVSVSTLFDGPLVTETDGRIA